MEFEQPIRAEVLGTARMAEQASRLALRHQDVTRGLTLGTLVPRLRENRVVLTRADAVLSEATRQNQTITPAAEWFLDNFHLIEDHLEAAIQQASLPRQPLLPVPVDQLQGAARPRIQLIAEAFVAHTDSRIDTALLQTYLIAYQAKTPLTLAELWALPAVLRYLLLDNLRRLGARVATSEQRRAAADAYADRCLAPGTAEGALDETPQGLPDGAIHSAFTTQLVHRLRHSEDVGARIPRWLLARLAAQGTHYAREVEYECTSQVAANQTVRNAFVSLSLIETFDWPHFVEAQSAVNRLLCQQADYRAMDFETRDRYRKAVENLAQRAGRAETVIAQAVIACAEVAAADPQAAERTRDLGYFLLDAGRAAFEVQLGLRPSVFERLGRAARARAVPLYLLSLGALTIMLVLPALAASRAAGVSLWGLTVLGLASALPASDLASLLIHRVTAWLVKPRRLPRLDFSEGVPPGCRTLVAVPTLLTNRAQIVEQIAMLEQHYLTNSKGDISFALLSDWCDADEPTHGQDAPLLAFARAELAALNDRYLSAQHQGAHHGARFYFLHRRRTWCDTEQRWLGWERKRGKLEELNRLLGGARDTTFMGIGDQPPEIPVRVRYVVTLDADTRMSYGTVAKLVGTAAHPLNQPVLDARGKVAVGYALLQPRVTPCLADGTENSLFQKVYSGPSGLDPYAGAVSDLYQDLFDEGSYTGKGLYDVAAFTAALHARVPAEKILSHDLFESLFARCALVSDVEVFEEFPSHAEVAAARTHRWTRGDWQLLPWALGRAEPINLLGRWKMIDNLRRSLSAPGTLATLVAAWAVPLAPSGWWLSLVGAAIFAPTVLALASSSMSVLMPRADARAWVQLPASLQAAVSAFQLGLMALVLLPHYAWLMLDAIIRTLYRMTISRRHLLEWVTAAQAKRRANFALGNFVWPLRGATVVTLGATALVLAFNITMLPWALPFIVVWWLSPLVARAISLPFPHVERDQLSPASREELRAIGRATWRYFSTFVGAADHHLPPDNFQEDPTPVIAHRTSPTNIGLYLLSAIAAHDLGWIGRRELVERLEATFRTLNGLPRHQGHFFNWYDTLEARALPPLYVSTVDSGNLAGHLLVIAQACAEFATRLSPSPAAFAGVRDSLHLFKQALAQSASSPSSKGLHHDSLTAQAAALDSLLIAPAVTAARLDQAWKEVTASAGALLDSVVSRSAQDLSGTAELLVWAHAIEASVASCRQDSYLSDTEADALQARLEHLAENARRLFSEMDFTVLFNPKRELFSIGLNVAENVLDEGHYDLLASEARLTSFISVASGAVLPIHWWRLGRSLTRVEGKVSLLSWSGSMFEYLMPSLVMHTPTGSLLDCGNRAAVRHQIAYAASQSLPWGMSESAYNARDRALTYQYKAFGVPRLGLKRGLAEDAVIAPYATALAAPFMPRAALANFKHLASMGARGQYGFLDALDFTSIRVPAGARCALVGAYMAHHQGMTIVALANAVDAKRMCDRFHREPMVRAAELLLQERVPTVRPTPRRHARAA